MPDIEHIGTFALNLVINVATWMVLTNRFSDVIADTGARTGEAPDLFGVHPYDLSEMAIRLVSGVVLAVVVPRKLLFRRRIIDGIVVAEALKLIVRSFVAQWSTMLVGETVEDPTD